MYFAESVECVAGVPGHVFSYHAGYLDLHPSLQMDVMNEPYAYLGTSVYPIFVHIYIYKYTFTYIV